MNLEGIDFVAVAAAFNAMSRAFIYYNENKGPFVTDSLFVSDAPINKPYFHYIVGKDYRDYDLSREYYERELTPEELGVFVETVLICENVDD
jgi:hypothetical protein